jgi:hypothetical protein
MNTYYDYDNQAWIENGVYAECGHGTILNPCYSCNHAGETPTGYIVNKYQDPNKDLVI